MNSPSHVQSHVLYSRTKEEVGHEKYFQEKKWYALFIHHVLTNLKRKEKK